MNGKTIEKVKTGERFIETATGADWRETLKTWDHDKTKPCPLPIGHHAFKYPELYGCRIVEVNND